MKKKHLYGAMLWAFLVTANLCTGCSDDNDYPDVDGQNPTMTLATDHIESGAGHRFTIEGTLEDKDGIASISLQCADLHLNKTIDLIEIYGAPQESYDLSYYFDINRNEIGERFTVKVTVTDVGGRSISQDVLITMDGDFAAPVFSAAPDATVTVLMKNETKFNLRFTATDDRALDYVTINIPGIDGFDNRRVDADGKSSLNFAEIIVFPNEPKSYNVTITAFDKKENSTTNFNYKNFDLSILLIARWDWTIPYGLTGWYRTDGLTPSPTVCDYWTPENQSARYPRPDASITNGQDPYQQWANYFDGSYLKVKTISLGYTFPKKWLNAVKIDRMRVYFTANNPFIFTKCDYLKNYDPEKGGNDDDAPLSKQYVFGVNISF